MIETPSPTPHPAINALLAELLAQVRTILGDHFTGMYLEGSLANGGFDEDSDIDFVVVTDQEITGDLFAALQAMHDHLATLDTPWAIELEGSYISIAALRRDDPSLRQHPNIERGRGERLKMAEHDASWNVHRWVLRERGIVLAGPHPTMLIDPVTPADLRRAMHDALSGWAASLLGDPTPIQFSGYQSYVVLSLCRIHYTLQHGAIVSKRVAAQWAQAALDARWAPLIERAWAGRHPPYMTAPPGDVDETLAFMRETVEGNHPCEDLRPSQG